MVEGGEGGRQKAERKNTQATVVCKRGGKGGGGGGGEREIRPTNIATVWAKNTILFKPCFTAVNGDF